MNNVPRVLLLEDNSTTRVLIASAMKAHGVEVITATSLKEVEAYIDDDSIDLYLMDINLPDGMSSAYVPRIVSQRPLIPVLMMTADQDYSQVANFFKAGVKDFITKPINPSLLVAKVFSFLRNADDKRALLAAKETYQKISDEKAQEEELAFHVYDYILKTHAHNITGVNVANRSSGKFCGDILLSAKAPNGNLIIMLADATGHGMAAALTIYPIVTTFSAMVSKGLSLGAILLELSEKHSQSIPNNRFVASIFIEISPATNTIKFWNGGMPKILAFDENRQQIEQIASKNMAIGILPTEMVSTQLETYHLDSVKHLCFFSDGLIENKIRDGAGLTFDQCYDIIAEQFDDPAGAVETMLALEDLSTISESDMDDMTICHIDIQNTVQALREESNYRASIPGQFEFNFKLQGHSLTNERLPFSVSEMLEGYGFKKEFCQRVFTVTTELYTNAVDHGVFNIDSALKSQNFIEYIDARSKAMEQLSDDQFVIVGIRWESEGQKLHINVADSGVGYRPHELEDDQDMTKAYGRGLALVKSFSETFNYDPNTNSTHIALIY